MSQELNFLPTGKQHVSFSEIKMWKECSYRHKLIHVDKIDLSEPSPYLDFGTAVHEGCETLIEHKKINKEKLLLDIKDAWKKYGFDQPEWYQKQPDWYKHVPVETWCDWAENMWDEVPHFLDETFPGWECFSAEEKLYEPIENKNAFFKGFIDGVLKVPKKRGKGHVYWILDWKTAQSYGWRREKKQDFLMHAQLIMYKHFWAKKNNIMLKDIRCGFILLKRGGKPGKVCELVKVSVGPKTLAKGIKMMNNMLASVRRGLALKNRDSCKYCAFYQTDHCR